MATKPMTSAPRGTRNHTLRLFVIALCTLLLVNCYRTPNSVSDPTLYALLWVRTSAEYEALCRQTFNIALEHVRREIKRQGVQTNDKPPAVVMDLDETVLDNSAYNVRLIKGGLRFSHDSWRRWNRENADEITLVPGAKQFIKAIEKEDVKVIFVSNRSIVIKDITTDILLKFDLARKEELLSNDPPKLLLRKLTSSKESRRETVRKHYNIIAFIGDNLGDFSDDFRSPTVNSIDERREKVGAHADQWGTNWFVMPNPLYGYWTRYIDWDEPERHFANTSN